MVFNMTPFCLAKVIQLSPLSHIEIFKYIHILLGVNQSIINLGQDTDLNLTQTVMQTKIN